jgi:hypothetical protein
MRIREKDIERVSKKIQKMSMFKEKQHGNNNKGNEVRNVKNRMSINFKKLGVTRSTGVQEGKM